MEKRITLAVLDACYEYYKQRQTVTALLLYWHVEIMYTDYITGRTQG